MIYTTKPLLQSAIAQTFIKLCWPTTSNHCHHHTACGARGNCSQKPGIKLCSTEGSSANASRDAYAPCAGVQQQSHLYKACPLLSLLPGKTAIQSTTRRTHCAVPIISTRHQNPSQSHRIGGENSQPKHPPSYTEAPAQPHQPVMRHSALHQPCHIKSQQTAISCDQLCIRLRCTNHAIPKHQPTFPEGPDWPPFLSAPMKLSNSAIAANTSQQTTACAMQAPDIHWPVWPHRAAPAWQWLQC